MSEPHFVEVAFPIPLNRTFHYGAPEGGAPVGSRVLAPFGKKTLVGYVVNTTDVAPPFAVKPLYQCLDPKPLINDQLLELARWLADEYLCSYGEALACMVPPALSPSKSQRVSDQARQRVGIFKAGSQSQARRPTGQAGTLTLKLTADQKRVLTPISAALDARTFQPFLLRGITDSGKTEVYLRSIDRAIRQGRQALYLLPEIALTPPFLDQLVARYTADKVGLWHSGRPGGERYQTWSRVHAGHIQVLLGARSAVFAPFPALGVIIMDEEHEPSYKQEDRPRYHTRDVALKRAEQTSAAVIMGSATPSLESYWHAKQGTYTLVEITSRIEERRLPPVDLIDRRSPPTGQAGRKPGTSFPALGSAFASRSSSSAVFSEELKLAIEQRLARQEQVMLFVNRRGFTPFLRCGVCGWVARCSRCSMTLSTHMDQRVSVQASKRVSDESAERETHSPARYLQCHACARKEPVIIQCPSCKSMRVRSYGVGTQKVEEEIRKLFPFARVARLDRDIATRRRSHEQIHEEFSKGDIDVLVGTQMIAKGFDFPKVTLVGVVDADVSLHLPDFRSAERTFQLITQVAGRTGRGPDRSRVLVQTHYPDHYALQAAKGHDYLGFYDREIVDRERLRYPPFCRIIRLMMRSSKESALHQSADTLMEKLEDLRRGDRSVDLLGPAPAPYSRLRNQFRYQILIKGDHEALLPYFRFLRTYRPERAFLVVDIDPMDLL